MNGINPWPLRWGGRTLRAYTTRLVFLTHVAANIGLHHIPPDAFGTRSSITRRIKHSPTPRPTTHTRPQAAGWKGRGEIRMGGRRDRWMNWANLF